MYFLSFNKTTQMGLTNQLFALFGGITNAINNNYNIVFIDQLLCDYSKDKYMNISNVLDLEKMNIYFKDKYGLILEDKYNFNFDLLNVNYGLEDNNLNITDIIKKKYYSNKKLFIDKDTNFNDICDHPCSNLKKYIWFEYRVNNNIIVDKYQENLINNIDYTNDNYRCVGMRFPSKNPGIFEDILTNIIFNKQFHDISTICLSDIILTNKVNVVHLRIEDDAIKHWSWMNKMSKEDFKTKLETKYIELIEQNIDKNDTTILLSSSFDNNVIKYLESNIYNYFTNKKYFEYRELNAIIDFIISKNCNNVFIGNFNFNGMNGSTFSYFIKQNLPNNIIYKYVDLDHV